MQGKSGCPQSSYDSFGVCRIPLSSGNPAEYPENYIGVRESWADIAPANKYSWSITRSAPPFLTIGGYIPIAREDAPTHPEFGKRVGVFASYMDSRFISTRMQNIVAQLPPESRMFGYECAPFLSTVYIRPNSPPPPNQKTAYQMTQERGCGTLVGASHGRLYLQGVQLAQVPDKPSIPVWNSTDVVISRMGRHIESVGYTKFGTTSGMREWVVPQDSGNTSGKAFFTSASLVPDEQGLEVYIVTMISKDEVMREITAALGVTRRRVADENKRTEDDRATDQLVMIVIVVCLAATLLAAAVYFTLVVTKPLYSLAHRMGFVANMELEKIDEKQPLSKLSEVRKMERSFLRMFRNMVEYRSYMPASLLAAGGEQEEEEVEEEVERNENMTKQSAATGSRVTGSRAAESARVGTASRSQSRRHGGTRASSVSASSASQSQRAKALLKQRTETGVKGKKVSMVCSNMLGWHGAWKSDGEMAGAHAAAIEQQLTASINEKGIPETFSGDRMLLSFNGVKNCAGHRQAACRAAAKIDALLQGAPQFAKYKGQIVSLAVVSGDVKCGNLGTDGMKKFSYLGVAVTWLHAMERFNAKIGSTIMTDKWLWEDTQGDFFYRMVDQVIFGKRHKKPIQLYQMMGQKEAGEDEWMYQLEEGAANDPHKTWDATMQALIDGRVSEAVESGKAVEDTLAKAGSKSGVEQRMLDWLAAANVAPDWKFPEHEILYH